jgi:hypothetical protein
LKKTLNAIVTVDAGTPNAASAVLRFSKQFGCGPVAPCEISNISWLHGANRKSCTPTSSSTMVSSGRLRREYNRDPVVSRIVPP